MEIVVNAHAGSVRSLGVEDVAAALRQSALKDAKLTLSGPASLQRDLTRAFQNEQNDVVFAGGGDGTISLAAQLASEHEKTLGILPFGTMNLFARALAIPLSIEDAIRAYDHAETTRVDVGNINGRSFFNHVSLGLHPKLIKLRDQLPHKGRLTKIASTARAFTRLLTGTSRRKLEIEVDGKIYTARSSLVLVTVNPIPNEIGQLPYRPGQSFGRLGLYVSTKHRSNDILRLAANLAAGRWSDHPDIRYWEAERIRIASRRPMHLSLDGEVGLQELPIHCSIQPSALKVLSPDESSG